MSKTNNETMQPEVQAPEASVCVLSRRWGTC